MLGSRFFNDEVFNEVKANNSVGVATASTYDFETVLCKFEPKLRDKFVVFKDGKNDSKHSFKYFIGSLIAKLYDEEFSSAFRYFRTIADWENNKRKPCANANSINWIDLFAAINKATGCFMPDAESDGSFYAKKIDGLRAELGYSNIAGIYMRVISDLAAFTTIIRCRNLDFYTNLKNELNTVLDKVAEKADRQEGTRTLHYNLKDVIKNIKDDNDLVTVLKERVEDNYFEFEGRHNAIKLHGDNTEHQIRTLNIDIHSYEYSQTRCWEFFEEETDDECLYDTIPLDGLSSANQSDPLIEEIKKELGYGDPGREAELTADERNIELYRLYNLTDTAFARSAYILAVLENVLEEELPIEEELVRLNDNLTDIGLKPLILECSKANNPFDWYVSKALKTEAIKV